MNQKKLRVAVVGLGFGAGFVEIYGSHPDVDSVAACDANPDRLRQVKERHPGVRVFTDVDEVVASDEIDAVHLLTGIPDHARHAVAVLKSGKHCACAVPMATSIADLRAIIAASREHRRNYMMMETAVYTRQFLFAKGLRDRGEFGRIQFLRGLHYQDMEGWPSYWAGLPPMWYSTHAVAPLLAIAGTRATKVHCFGSGEMREELRKLYGNPYPVETATFELATPGLYAEVTRTLFHCARPYMESFVVYGENACYEGQMESENPMLFRMTPVVQGQWRRESIERPDPPARPDLLPPELGQFAAGGHHGSHPHLVHEFVRSIVEQRQPWIDAVTAANWTAAGICAHESAMAGGREVVIPEFG